MPAVAKKSAFTIYKLTDGASIYIGITTGLEHSVASAQARREIGRLVRHYSKTVSEEGAKGFEGVTSTVERPPRTLYDQRTEDDRGDLCTGSSRRVTVEGQV